MISASSWPNASGGCQRKWLQIQHIIWRLVIDLQHYKEIPLARALLGFGFGSALLWSLGTRKSPDSVLLDGQSPWDGDSFNIVRLNRPWGSRLKTQAQVGMDMHQMTKAGHMDIRMAPTAVAIDQLNVNMGHQGLSPLHLWLYRCWLQVHCDPHQWGSVCTEYSVHRESSKRRFHICRSACPLANGWTGVIKAKVMYWRTHTDRKPPGDVIKLCLWRCDGCWFHYPGLHINLCHQVVESTPRFNEERLFEYHCSCCGWVLCFPIFSAAARIVSRRRSNIIHR